MSFINWEVQAARIHGNWGAAKERIKKAAGDLTRADLNSSGGLMSEADAATFWKQAIPESKLVSAGTIAPMKSHTQNFPLVGFNSRISHRVGAGTALSQAQRSKADLATVPIATDQYKAAVYLPDDAVEDNIEGEAFKNLVFGLAKTRIMADIELLGLVSDTTSTTEDFKGFDGVIASITTNTVDFGGAGVTRAYLKSMMQTMAAEDLNEPGRLRFVTSTHAKNYYVDQISQTGLDIAGILFNITGSKLTPGYNEVAVMPCPVMPENIGTGSNKTVVLFGDPKGIYWGFWKQLKVEFDRDVEAGMTKAVFTYRFAAKVADESAWVKGYDVAPNP
jgi:hypothetical protein